MIYVKTPLCPTFNVTDIINISYYKLNAGYVFWGEQHAFWEFLYVDRGDLFVTADESKFHLRAGEIVFHCPGEFHAFRSDCDSDVIVVSFLCSGPMERFLHKVATVNQQCRQCLGALVSEAALAYQYFENDPARVNLHKKDTAPFGCDHMIKSYIEQLFVMICRSESVNLSTRPYAVLPTQLHRHKQIVWNAKEYIGAHYSEKITLSLLAEKLHISTSLLKKGFREQTGTTVIAYLTALRIGEAKRLVRAGKLNFTQIAECVGFDSIYYFSSLFKKHTGMSLTEYAKSLKE